MIKNIKLNMILDSQAFEFAKKRLDDLKGQLADTKNALDEAKGYKDTLDGLLATIEQDGESRKDRLRSRDDDSYVGSGSSSSAADTYFLGGMGTGTLASLDLTGLTADALGATTPSGVAGVRTGRTVARGGAADNSGVLGVKTENKSDTKKETTDTSSKTDNAGKNDTEGNNLVKVENSMVPLADTPFEEGTNMNLLWLLGAATAAGVGAYGYGLHKKKVAANDEAKKYKK